jgi:hypothetical protein
VTYTPETDYYGEDGFTYTVKDNNGAVSNEAVVTITVIQNDDDGDSGDDGNSGGGGGCSYNPHAKNFDAGMLLMMLLAAFYPLRRRFKFGKVN